MCKESRYLLPLKMAMLHTNLKALTAEAKRGIPCMYDAAPTRRSLQELVEIFTGVGWPLYLNVQTVPNYDQFGEPTTALHQFDKIISDTRSCVQSYNKNMSFPSLVNPRVYQQGDQGVSATMRGKAL